MMKKLVIFSIAAFFSIMMGLFVPRLLVEDDYAIENFDNSSILKQSITNYSDANHTIYKIYDSGKLIGVVKDINKLNKDIEKYDFNTDFDYGDRRVGLTENIYIVDELSKLSYEDIDDQVLDYLADNDCIGIETDSVEFYTDKGLYDKIYISSEDDFNQAKDQFILNFISQETLNEINSGNKIESPTVFGTVETGIKINEKMKITKGITTPNNILKNVSEIYEYLCYGDNEERQYYTTKQGDTLSGVGYYFNYMSAKQIMMLNPDIIKDENQIIKEGTVLNVTYYTSPLTVVVTKERLAQEVLFPDPAEYVEDNDLPIGMSKIDVVESNGLRNVLYSEIWVNGVLQEGTEKSSVDVKAATRGKILIGTGTIIPSGSAGTGNWRWPVSNPKITCDYYCYANHGGVDFYNLYNPWDYVLAIDAGTVIAKGWTDAGGYFCRIDHNNGYITYYGHFSSLPYVEVGQSVAAGEVLGPIGMTGIATGPHVHLAMYENNVMVNPCTVLNCSLLY